MRKQERNEEYVRILTFVGSLIAVFDSLHSLVQLVFINASRVSYPFFHPALTHSLLLLLSLFLVFKTMHREMGLLTEIVLLLFGCVFLLLGSFIAGAFLLIASLISFFG